MTSSHPYSIVCISEDADLDEDNQEQEEDSEEEQERQSDGKIVHGSRLLYSGVRLTLTSLTWPVLRWSIKPARSIVNDLPCGLCFQFTPADDVRSDGFDKKIAVSILVTIADW